MLDDSNPLFLVGPDESRHVLVVVVVVLISINQGML